MCLAVSRLIDSDNSDSVSLRSGASRIVVAALACCVLLLIAANTHAQSGRRQRPADEKPPQAPATPAPTPTPPGLNRPGDNSNKTDTPDEDLDSPDAVKVDTNLVVVPVIASTHNDIYVPDLRADELEVYEDGVKQEIAFFASVTEPFTVVLMIDTSASTEEKLVQLQQAAIDFVAQLNPDDRVKLISFDDRIRVLSPFTSDRAALRAAIYQTTPGQGTRLYDAMETAISSFRRIRGRKAIVLLTDGVDSYSETATYDQNQKALEEAGIIVYPVRFETRCDVEDLISRQQRGGRNVDLGSILRGRLPRQPTPGTFPGGGGGIPPQGPGGGGTIGGIPAPPIILGGPNQRDPNDPSNWPNGRNDPYPSGSNGTSTTTCGYRLDSMTKAELDRLYITADSYLNTLSRITGGTLQRASTMGALPQAFQKIAAELRTQFSVGYYPQNSLHDGKFHKLSVKTTRKDVVIRSRPGYRTKAQ